MPDMKKAKINNSLYEVTSFDEFVSNRKGFIQSHTAIEEGEYVLPIIGLYDNGPGIKIGTAIAYVNLPQTDEEKETYSTKNVINFSDSKTMADIINKQHSIMKMEREVLTSPDNIFIPKILDTDSAEMRGIKEAIIDKNIDLDKYEHRFGANYNNDKRLFNKDTISLPMIKRICGALDIKATLTLEDASSDVPNPIGRKISMEITGSGDKSNE